MQSTKKTVLILAALAALLTAVGTFTNHWRSAERDHSSRNVGLRTWEECDHSGCESASWSEVRGSAGRSNSATIGPIAFFVGIGALLLLAALAGAPLFAPDRAPLLGQLALIASIAFLGLGVIYILSFPSGFIPIGWSAYVGWAGGALGIGAGALARRRA